MDRDIPNSRITPLIALAIAFINNRGMINSETYKKSLTFLCTLTLLAVVVFVVEAEVVLAAAFHHFAFLPTHMALRACKATQMRLPDRPLQTADKKKLDGWREKRKSLDEINTSI